MTMGSLRTAVGAAVLVCVLAPAAVTASDRSAEAVEQAVLKLDAIRDLDDLSRELWPGWKISETAFALYEPDGEFCVLVNHHAPPPGFDSKRTSARRRVPFDVGRLDEATPDDDSLNGESTAYVPWDRFDADAVSCAFEEAFRAHVRSECADLKYLAPPVDGYPLTPENLALSDIECELLMRAATAPVDSLQCCILEFVAVRNYRRIRLSSPAAEAYESKLERLAGMAAYVGERARAEAPRRVPEKDAELIGPGRGEPFDAGACMARPRDLDWYRSDRYRATGAMLCGLLDRFRPEWRRESEACPDPNALLVELTRTRLPRAFGILIRYGFRDRIDERETFIDGLKSDAERLFDSIVAGEGTKLVINTGLLASSSVSYDPENVVQVDDHRFVHERILKIEFSGGTRVHVMGVPVAANVGQGEFDIEQLTLVAPSEYVVRIAGVPVQLASGVNQFEEPLSVSADGLLIEARSGVIMVGEGKVTFMLHR